MTAILAEANVLHYQSVLIGARGQHPRIDARSSLISQPVLIRLPAGAPILLRLFDRILRLDNPPPDNNDIAPPLTHDIVRGIILLPQAIAAPPQRNPRAHHDEVLPLRSALNRTLRNKADHKVRIPPRHRDRLCQVFAAAEIALAAHLAQHQQAAVRARVFGRDGAQSLDDALAGHGVRIRDVCPGGDAVDATAVLVLHGAADVGELAVLEDEEVVARGEGLEGVGEGGDGVGGREGDYVDVGFDEAEFGAEVCVWGVVREGWVGREGERGGVRGGAGVPSMRERTCEGEVRSTERQRFDFLAAMIERRRRPTAVGWDLERSP